MEVDLAVSAVDMGALEVDLEVSEVIVVDTEVSEVMVVDMEGGEVALEGLEVTMGASEVALEA